MLTPLKKTFGFILLNLFVCSGMEAQIYAPTYYVIPPVNGCDGVWAISDSAYGCDGSTPTDTTPSGGPCCLMSGWTFSGDTIFIPLCSIPCSIAFYNAIGNPDCGWAQTPGTLSTGNIKSKEKIYGYPSLLKAGGIYTLHCESCIVNTISIYDIRGRKQNAVFTRSPDGNLNATCENLAPGIYFVRDETAYFPAVRFTVIR